MGDRNRADLKIIAVILAAVALLLGILAMVGGPLMQEAATAFAPGLGLKTAALWGFCVTVGLLVVFAIVAGDSLFGEIQFMLGSFFTFFVVITLLIAWVF